MQTKTNKIKLNLKNLHPVRLAAGIRKAPGDAVHQQHHRRTLHAQRLHFLPLLHPQQSH